MRESNDPNNLNNLIISVRIAYYIDYVVTNMQLITLIAQRHTIFCTNEQ